MLIAKQTADLLTYLRGFLTFIFIWLGLTHGADGLIAAICMMLLSWTTDGVDGPIARRSGSKYQSWIGSHDLEVDMAVSGGLLVYLATADFIDPIIAGIYAAAWILFFWRKGIIRSIGMFVQAPIYGWFIWVALRDAFPVGQWLIIWIVTAVVITWPRFPKEIIPDFLNGLRLLRRQN